MANALVRQMWGGAVGALVAGRTMLPVAGLDARVFYGGAFGGAKGGPQVKVDLLRQKFPEHRFDFNLVYLVSGALFMPDTAFRFLERSGIPVVLNQNGVFYPAWSPEGWQEQNARMARVMENATHVFYQSEFCRRCADKFLGVRPTSSEILYNGVDTDVFHPAEGRRQNARFRFLMAGNFSSAAFYRVQNVIEAVALAVRDGLNIELVLAGLAAPESRAAAERLAGSVNIADRVLVSGTYSRDQAPEIFQDADAYIMNKPNDPCPNAVLEAMASGLPVLYSASGGVPELVGRDAGVPVQVDESFDENVVPAADDLADGMAKIIAGSADFALAARARAVARFSLPHWVNRHAQVFTSLISARKT